MTDLTIINLFASNVLNVVAGGDFVDSFIISPSSIYFLIYSSKSNISFNFIPFTVLIIEPMVKRNFMIGMDILKV